MMTATAPAHIADHTSASCTERVFAGVPAEVGAARRWVRSIVEEAICSAVADDAVLVVSELATNALRYSVSGRPGGQFTVSVAPRPDGVLLQVRDQGPVPDAAGNGCGPAEVDGHGWGLGLVSELAAVFGTATGEGWPAPTAATAGGPRRGGCVWCYLTATDVPAGQVATAGSAR